MKGQYKLRLNPVVPGGHTFDLCVGTLKECQDRRADELKRWRKRGRKHVATPQLGTPPGETCSRVVGHRLYFGDMTIHYIDIVEVKDED